ncbi:MAG: hypothetical protein AAF517_10820, partial [Planctomycetota bacterium]
VGVLLVLLFRGTGGTLSGFLRDRNVRMILIQVVLFVGIGFLQSVPFDNGAHIGGFVTGLLVGPALLVAYRRPGLAKIWRVACLLGVAGMVSAATWMNLPAHEWDARAREKDALEIEEEFGSRNALRIFDAFNSAILMQDLKAARQMVDVARKAGVLVEKVKALELSADDLERRLAEKNGQNPKPDETTPAEKPAGVEN